MRVTAYNGVQRQFVEKENVQYYVEFAEVKGGGIMSNRGNPKEFIETRARAEPGKYLIFEMAKEDYGIGILDVQEIIGLMDVTPVPKMPEYVRGIINLRGKVIPVVDLKCMLGMGETEFTPITCIIIVRVTIENEKLLLGIVVDTVKEVAELEEKDIEPTPTFGAKVRPEFILGIGKSGKKMKILLDINKILTTGELLSLKEFKEGGQNA